jgi:ech hydrogenase subunit C
VNLLRKSRIKSPWIVHFNCNSCNGCDIETVACLTPIYDVERFGIVNTGNPKHADVLVVTGSVNHRNIRALRNIYDQIPSPKAVVAIGACAATGGIFADCYNVIGGIDKVIPVDVYVPGCCPRPEAIIDGIVLAIQKMDSREQEAKKAKGSKSTAVSDGSGSEGGKP